jgi:predicted anti-sigma-YlaC factor YlaD
VNVDNSSHPRDRLSAYLDGELPPVEATAVAQHVRGCADCQAELDGANQVRQLLRQLQPPQVPFGLVERLLMRPRRRVLPVAWAASAAAAIALGVIAAGTTSSRPPTVAHLVQVNATSTGRDPVSGLAPVAVPVSFGP